MKSALCFTTFMQRSVLAVGVVLVLATPNKAHAFGRSKWKEYRTDTTGEQASGDRPGRHLTISVSGNDEGARSCAAYLDHVSENGKSLLQMHEGEFLAAGVTHLDIGMQGSKFRSDTSQEESSYNVLWRPIKRVFSLPGGFYNEGEDVAHISIPRYYQKYANPINWVSSPAGLVRGRGGDCEKFFNKVLEKIGANSGLSADRRVYNGLDGKPGRDRGGCAGGNCGRGGGGHGAGTANPNDDGSGGPGDGDGDGEMTAAEIADLPEDMREEAAQHVAEAYTAHEEALREELAKASTTAEKKRIYMQIADLRKAAIARGDIRFVTANGKSQYEVVGAPPSQGATPPAPQPVVQAPAPQPQPVNPAPQQQLGPGSAAAQQGALPAKPEKTDAEKQRQQQARANSIQGIVSRESTAASTSASAAGGAPVADNIQAVNAALNESAKQKEAKAAAAEQNAIVQGNAHVAVEDSVGTSRTKTTEQIAHKESYLKKLLAEQRQLELDIDAKADRFVNQRLIALDAMGSANEAAQKEELKRRGVELRGKLKELADTAKLVKIQSQEYIAYFSDALKKKPAELQAKIEKDFAVQAGYAAGEFKFDLVGAYETEGGFFGMGTHWAMPNLVSSTLQKTIPAIRSRIDLSNDELAALELERKDVSPTWVAPVKPATRVASN